MSAGLGWMLVLCELAQISQAERDSGLRNRNGLSELAARPQRQQTKPELIQADKGHDINLIKA